MNRLLSSVSAWQVRLHAWPGVLTLMSVLAVLLGAPVPAPDLGARVSAGRFTPALPEARPAPSPVTPVPFPPAPAPEPYRLPVSRLLALARPWVWPAPLAGPDLSVLGRRQSDGG
ncbi:hypothetical protein [Deinococcus knuensis]|nr:hypothetical protein [Deinococcus knuensis]